jgi:hypothetical protein
MQVYLDDTIDSYRRFLRIKSLPRYEIHGRMAWFPDEYAGDIGVAAEEPSIASYEPRQRTHQANSKTLFDAQEAVA